VHAQKVLAGIEEAADALARLHQIETGRFALSASTTIGNYVLPKVLGTFHARYPGVEIWLDINNSEEVCEEVRQGPENWVSSKVFLMMPRRISCSPRTRTIRWC
jgi:DNA-binding transcriptional LysR family regulator